MKIESLRVTNYKVYKSLEIDDIPNMAVFIGKNGAGKTTFLTYLDFFTIV